MKGSGSKGPFTLISISFIIIANLVIRISKDINVMLKYDLKYFG